MQDYIPQDPDRKKIIHADGSVEYVHIESADNPVANNPTPLNKATLLDDNTCALLGLPGTATPNDAFGALGLSVSTTSVSTVFGQEGYLEGGRFRDVASNESAEFAVKTSNTNGNPLDVVYSGIADEYVVFYVSAVDSGAYLQRIKWDGAEKNFHFMGNAFSFGGGACTPNSAPYILSTGDPAEFVVMLKRHSPNYNAHLQRVRWNGASFDKKGSGFVVAAESASARIFPCGVDNTYLVLARAGGLTTLQRINWTGTAFIQEGTAFTLVGSVISDQEWAITSTEVADEFLLTDATGTYDYYLQRVRWTGNAFEKLGNALKINSGKYFFIDTDIQAEYILARYNNQQGNNLGIQRIKWDGMQLKCMGNYFVVRGSGTNEAIGMNSSIRNNLFLIFGDGRTTLQRIKWEETGFYNMGEKLLLNISNCSSPLCLIRSGIKHEYIFGTQSSGIKVQRVFNAAPNANALQTRKPTQKCVVIKQ